MQRACTKFEGVELVDGAGHWVQQERAEHVAASPGRIRQETRLNRGVVRFLIQINSSTWSGNYCGCMSATAAVAAPQKPEWFASWFDSEHYHRLYANRDRQEAGAFVDRLIERLDPAPGAAMLDLGCGSGRHSRSLAVARPRGHRHRSVGGEPGPRARGGEVQPCDSSSRTCGRRSARGPSTTSSACSRVSATSRIGAITRRSSATSPRSLKAGGTLVLDYLNVASRRGER